MLIENILFVVQNRIINNHDIFYLDKNFFITTNISLFIDIMPINLFIISI